MKKFLNVLNIPLLFYLTICVINILNKRLYANTKPQATQQDIFLYKQMGASYLCKAINERIDLDFKKSLTISTYTFAEVIFSKHGNLIEGEGNEKVAVVELIEGYKHEFQDGDYISIAEVEGMKLKAT